MVNLNVSYQEMHDEAQKLRASKEQINGEITALRSRISALTSGGFVTDAASGRFNGTVEQFSTSATTMINSLDDLANLLSGMATTLQETDQSLANQMGG